MSGLALISPLCMLVLPQHFGGHDYRPHGSLATAATRSSVLLFYTLRLSNRHYFPSKSFSPSSQIHHPRKEEPYCGVHKLWPKLELSQEAAASTNAQRTPCFRCFLQDVRLTSIREQRIIWLSKFLRAIPVLHLAPDESNAAVQRIELLYTGWLLPFRH